MSRDKLPPESELDRTELLEQLVDEHGLAGVLDRLSDVCSLKAEHVRSNWQPIPEEGLPTTWDDAAAAINDATASVAQLGLNVDATTVTRARQTGATVEQLRREAKYAQYASRIAQWLDRCDEDGMTSLEIAEAIMAKVTPGEAVGRLYDAIDQDLTEDEEEGGR